MLQSKRVWSAQLMLILLKDLAHNLITEFRNQALAGTSLAEFGAYRMIQEVFNIPGRDILEQDRLLEIQLLETHPHARTLAEALPRFWKIYC